LSIPLEDVQGLILRSYGMDQLRLFALHVEETQAAKVALGRLPVMNGAIWTTKPDYCVNVAFTFAGFQALGLSPEGLASFPEEFRLGAAARADIVGDTGDSAPEHWKDAWAGPDVHLLVILFAQTSEICETQTKALRALWASGFREISASDAAILPGNAAHFGFRDGFSQPTIEGGLPNPVTDALLSAPAGEFLLGYLSQFNAFTYPVPQPDALGLNGSFMALRILSQDCAAFERLLASAPQQYGLEGEKLAAKLVGRWRNGAPLELSPDDNSPASTIRTT
jgi:deferrochelatase/peroxidase EfeB